jgi:hypothetical protein
VELIRFAGAEGFRLGINNSFEGSVSRLDLMKKKTATSIADVASIVARRKSPISLARIAPTKSLYAILNSIDNLSNLFNSVRVGVQGPMLDFTAWAV